MVSCEEGLASKHHWETVMMRDGMRVAGRMSSGESLISLLRSSVRVSGQMAKTRPQAGLVEKSFICVCCWNVGHDVTVNLVPHFPKSARYLPSYRQSTELLA